jgi:SAM-dependent methyltransferase
MRKSFRIQYFDIILNLFTSFGYFDKEEDNLIALKNVCNGLKPDGIFILDYFNAEWVKATLTTDYHIVASDIDFHIQKTIDNEHVIKTIEFEAEGKVYHFQEKVRLFTLSNFELLFEKAGLTIIKKFGDYQLHPFDEKNSPRLIIQAKQS